MKNSFSSYSFTPTRLNTSKSPSLFDKKLLDYMLHIHKRTIFNEVPKILTIIPIVFFSYIYGNAQTHLPCNDVTTACVDHPSEPTLIIV